MHAGTNTEIDTESVIEKIANSIPLQRTVPLTRGSKKLAVRLPLGVQWRYEGKNLYMRSRRRMRLGLRGIKTNTERYGKGVLVYAK